MPDDDQFVVVINIFHLLGKLLRIVGSVVKENLLHIPHRFLDFIF